MGKSLEGKFEALIQQMKTQQYDGELTSSHSRYQLAPEELAVIAEEIKNADRALRHQKEELLFAYQTLEVGYQRYWELFNYAPDGYLVTDTNGTIGEANQTILSMLSVKPADLIGRPIISVIPGLKRYDFGMQLNWFSGSQTIEVQLQPSGRTPFYASISIAPQCNMQKKAVGLLWLIRDITERKQIEEELQNRRSELSLMLEQTPCALWTTDNGLRFTSVSGSRMAELNISPDKIIGVKLSDFYRHKSAIHILNAHQRALGGESNSYEFENNNQIFQATVEPLKSTQGTISGVIGAAFDITDRKQSEKILRKSEKFNASLLEHSPNPISVINTDGSISYVNPAFEKLTHFSAQAAVGLKAPFPWWREETATKNAESFPKYLKKRSGKREESFRKSNGEEFWVEVSTILIRNEDEPDYYLQTWTDITEAKRLRENLEFYMMQITRAQEEERKRIAQELHEETLQSLAALCLATETIIRSTEQDPGQAIEDLKGLKDKINGVIEKVRQFSYDLRPGVLDYLGQTAALETLVDELNEKGIQTTLVVTGKERSLPADMEISIFRMVQEALRNTLKYSRAHKATVSIKYSTGGIRLSVTDNGRGFILPDNLSELVNQGKLGLIGVAERTRLYRGSFTIKSYPKKGTRIAIILPYPLKANRGRQK